MPVVASSKAPAGARPARKSERLPKRERILRRGEFLRVQNHGRKLHTDAFMVFALHTGHAVARLGVTVSKKVGNAVQRNRVKRLVREVYRRNKAVVPPRLDLVVVAKRSAVALPLEGVLEQFRAACRQLTSILARGRAARSGADGGGR